jgi:hypothetical protein
MPHNAHIVLPEERAHERHRFRSRKPRRLNRRDRLNKGALGLVDISASTMANIGPAYSFYFSAGFLFLTAGVAAPLTIIVAGIAIALLGNTLSQFSRVHPSTGGFISYVGKSAAVLLPPVPAAGLQRPQARGAAGARHDRGRGADVLPGQAGAGLAP